MKTAVKERRHQLKFFEIALLIGLAVFLTSGALALRTQNDLAEKVVRLHVLANSDSEEDQALKLKVRDVVLERATAILEESPDRREAESRLRGELLELERIAAAEIVAEGYDYPVTVELENTEFPTKAYDGFTLPAGEYLALRVIIGEGKGRNWWCVVFPPLCTAACTDMEQVAIDAGLSGDDVKLITEEDGYVLRFRAVELWQRLRQWLGK